MQHQEPSGWQSAPSLGQTRTPVQNADTQRAMRARGLRRAYRGAAAILLAGESVRWLLLQLYAEAAQTSWQAWLMQLLPLALVWGVWGLASRPQPRRDEWFARQEARAQRPRSARYGSENDGGSGGKGRSRKQGGGAKREAGYEAGHEAQRGAEHEAQRDGQPRSGADERAQADAVRQDTTGNGTFDNTSADSSASPAAPPSGFANAAPDSAAPWLEASGGSSQMADGSASASRRGFHAAASARAVPELRLPVVPVPAFVAAGGGSLGEAARPAAREARSSAPFPSSADAASPPPDSALRADASGYVNPKRPYSWPAKAQGGAAVKPPVPAIIGRALLLPCLLLDAAQALAGLAALCGVELLPAWPPFLAAALFAAAAWGSVALGGQRGAVFGVHQWRWLLVLFALLSTVLLGAKPRMDNLWPLLGAGLGSTALMALKASGTAWAAALLFLVPSEGMAGAPGQHPGEDVAAAGQAGRSPQAEGKSSSRAQKPRRRGLLGGLWRLFRRRGAGGKAERGAQRSQSAEADPAARPAAMDGDRLPQGRPPFAGEAARCGLMAWAAVLLLSLWLSLCLPLSAPIDGDRWLALARLGGKALQAQAVVAGLLWLLLAALIACGAFAESIGRSLLPGAPRSLFAAVTLALSLGLILWPAAAQWLNLAAPWRLAAALVGGGLTAIRQK